MSLWYLSALYYSPKQANVVSSVVCILFLQLNTFSKEITYNIRKLSIQALDPDLIFNFQSHKRYDTLYPECCILEVRER